MPQVQKGCSEIGDVQAADSVWGSFYEAETKLKNKIAEQGGNAYVIQYVGTHVEINAKAYRCN
jgi:hypothetical protein